MEELSFFRLTGSHIETVFEDLARLRIGVFRSFPYLYEGSTDYEKEYLKTYFKADRSFLFGVRAGERLVGATTCIPLEDETDEVQQPFLRAGIAPETVFYFGESLLLPEWRGGGLGHRYFDEREAHAASFGTFRMTCFCSVVRPENHPAKPAGYRPHDVFWSKRGYRPEPSLQSFFDWTDIGDTESTAKPMIYWTKPLDA